MKKILVFLAIIGFCGNATALQSTQNIQRGKVYYISHDKGGFSAEQTAIVFGIGIITGLIIYNLTATKCENRLICTKF